MVVSLSQQSGELFDIPSGKGTPERNLLMAILERAILDYVGNDKKELEEAGDWLFGDLENYQHDEFSFPWLCEQLDLDPQKTAGIIKQIPRRGMRRVAPWYVNRDYIAKAC